MTAGRRGVATVLMFVGIGLTSILIATVALYFVTQNADEDKADLVERLDRFGAALVELSVHPAEREAAETLTARKSARMRARR